MRAIGLTARNAGVAVQYQAQIVEGVTKSVTIHAVKVPLGKVLDQVLAGTGLRAIPASDGVTIAPINRENAVQGIVSGVVTDAATKRPIVGVVITLTGTSYTVRTDDDGKFRFAGIPAGKYRLAGRRLGYQPYSTVVDVEDGKSVTVSIAMAAAASRLNEVVTTATGKQRRVEVGNVIAHINVDSVAKTAPVMSLTDLLSARAAGVQVVETNGLVGSGPAIRIRGQSSLAAASDPIIIVDGIRVDNTPGGNVNPIFGAVASSSRLNDIDFSQVESIDILKGPSASSEYGTDAANGVIVITTKRAQSGRTQWHVSGERGWSDVPTGFDDLYFGWTSPVRIARRGYTTSTNCTIAPMQSGAVSEIAGTCHTDSVTHFNPLNHRSTTLYGNGLQERINLDVGGGSEAIRYFLAGGFSRGIGTLKLPDVYRSQAILAGVPKSEWQPNSQTQPSVRANLNAHLMPTLELALDASYVNTKQIAPGVATLLSGLIGGVPLVPDSVHGYGYGQQLTGPLSSDGFSNGQVQDTRRMIGSTTARWQPTGWFSTRFIGGMDHASGRTQAETSPQSLVATGQQAPDGGSLSISNGTTDVLSSDIQASSRFDLSRSLASTTTIGWQTARTEGQSVTAWVFLNLPGANQSLNGVPNPSVAQQGNVSATAGGYAEERLAFAERLFLTGAIRVDGASGFGNDYHTTTYPKLSASWIAIPGEIFNARLRSAIGASGVQPINGASFSLYNPTVVYLSGGSTSAATLTSPGNPNLRPERTREYEVGADLSFLADRFTLELTHYRKRTTDALTRVGLGGTIGPNYFVQENLGKVENSGVEATVQANLIRQDAFNWNVTFNASSNKNVLKKINADVTHVSVYGGQDFAVGYPLYGYWGLRATYADANHDGVIAPSEVTLADSATFMGSSIPKIEMSIANQFGFFRNAILINALIDIKRGYVIRNGPALNAASVGVLREQHDSTAPLWLQARAVAQAFPGGGSNSLAFEDGSFVRFRELSMTYAIPSRLVRRLRVSSLSLNLAVRNLALWTHYTGGDPEVSDVNTLSDGVTGASVVNSDVRYNYTTNIPLTRTWLLRFNAGF